MTPRASALRFAPIALTALAACSASPAPLPTPAPTAAPEAIAPAPTAAPTRSARCDVGGERRAHRRARDDRRAAAQPVPSRDGAHPRR